MLNFSFDNVDINKVIAAYAKASGKTFVVDSNVKGTTTIILAKPITIEEAFNYLSTSLAANQFAIVPEGELLHVMSSRQAMQWGIETVTETPSAKPERMITMVFKLKYISANEITKRLRILPSRDGELTPYEPTNQLIVTDWTTNLRRIAGIIQLLDQPVHKGAKPDTDRLYDDDGPDNPTTKPANSPQPSPTPAK